MLRRYSLNSDIAPNVILVLGSDQQNLPSIHSNDSAKTSGANSIDLSTDTAVATKTSWACHKNILTVSSTYFRAIFTNQFKETEASVVFLPSGILTAEVLDDVLYFMYNTSIPESLTVPTESDEPDYAYFAHIQSIYLAADYFGIDSLCSTVSAKILQLTHNLVCYCNHCTLLIPQLLLFTGPNDLNDLRLGNMTLSIVKLLVSDPEKALSTYWTSPALARLFSHNAETRTLHNYLEAQLLEHVNKNNAIETLHGSFIADRVLSKDVAIVTTETDWSDMDLLACTLKRIHQAGSRLLTDHFDFYCTEYPELLSCVDGISFSFEFLEYVLLNITTEPIMNTDNVCLLYKGIVKHLLCRHAAQHTEHVKKILQSAKQNTVRFIATHLKIIKEQELIDRSIAESLAQDLMVPVDSLLMYEGHSTKRSYYQNSNSRMSSSSSMLPHSTGKGQRQKLSNKKKSLTRPDRAGWDSKLRSRIWSILFRQPAVSLAFKPGQRVELLNKPVTTTGTIKYVGKLDHNTIPLIDKNKKSNIDDYFLGIELDKSVGLSDGSLSGRRYFTTLPNRGTFVKPSEVMLV